MSRGQHTLKVRGVFRWPWLTRPKAVPKSEIGGWQSNHKGDKCEYSFWGEGHGRALMLVVKEFVCRGVTGRVDSNGPKACSNEP